MFKTYIPKMSEKKTEWYLVDAKDEVLGRLASRVATILRAKDTVEFTPHQDSMRGVVVINASQIKVTGKKLKQKTYPRYSGYPGGFKEETLENLLKKKPEEVIRHAVKGMLPKTKLSDMIIKRLKIYAGSEHQQAAQKPKSASAS